MRETRLPISWIPASYLGHLPSIVGLVTAGVVVTVTPGIWPGPIAWWVLGPLLALRVIDPWYERASFRASTDDSRLTIRSGIVHRRTRSIRWTDAGTVTIDAPWHLRTLGLAQISIAQAGSDATRLVIPAADATTRSIIETHLEQRLEPRAASEASRPVAASDGHSVHATDGVLIHRSTTVELVIASLVLGRFVIAGAGLAVAVWELLGTAGLTDSVTRLGSSSVPLVVGAASVIVLLGIPATVLRYWGLEVRASADGGLRIRYGLLTLRDRRIDPAAVVGVVLRRNPLEQLLGRARLGVLTLDSASQLGTNLLLPSLPAPTVRAVLDRLPARQLVGLRLPDRQPIGAGLGRFLVLLVLAFAAGGAAYALGARPWLVALTALVALAGAVVIGTVLSTRLELDTTASVAACTTSLVGEHQRTVDAGAIHIVQLLGPVERGGIARLHFYAGRRRTLTATRVRSEDLQALGMLAVREAPAAVARRLTLANPGI